MLDTEIFVGEMKQRGFNFFSGVPCSILKNFINALADAQPYFIASNEGDAVAMCAGAYLAGKKPIVLMQNSGLTNALSPLVSLNEVFRIPVLGFIGLRGEANSGDEPQHELIGKITSPLLDLMGIHWIFLSTDIKEACEQLRTATRFIENGRSFFFIVRKGTFGESRAPEKSRQYRKKRKRTVRKCIGEPLRRPDVLKTVISERDENTAIITTTGYTSRELFELGDAENNFYMIGSMGCAGSLGLGLSAGKPQKKFIVVDGDGALLMRLGSMASIGYYQPKNLLHILLDNNAYESTGNQETVSENINFVDIATSCGYEHSFSVCSLENLSEKLSQWKSKKGLTFLSVRIGPGTLASLGRPTISPEQLKERFMSFLENEGGSMN